MLLLLLLLLLPLPLPLLLLLLLPLPLPLLLLLLLLPLLLPLLLLLLLLARYLHEQLMCVVVSPLMKSNDRLKQMKPDKQSCLPATATLHTAYISQPYISATHLRCHGMGCLTTPHCRFSAECVITRVGRFLTRFKPA